jgi:hypothetical protein
MASFALPSAGQRLTRPVGSASAGCKITDVSKVRTIVDVIKIPTMKIAKLSLTIRPEEILILEILLEDLYLKILYGLQ